MFQLFKCYSELFKSPQKFEQNWSSLTSERTCPLKFHLYVLELLLVWVRLEGHRLSGLQPILDLPQSGYGCLHPTQRVPVFQWGEWSKQAMQQPSPHPARYELQTWNLLACAHICPFEEYNIVRIWTGLKPQQMDYQKNTKPNTVKIWITCSWFIRTF